MNKMFYNCVSLVSLDLSRINGSNIIDISSIFDGCFSLKSLSLFKESHLLNIDNMFHLCKSLNSLDLFGLDTSKVTNMNSAFSGCSSLINLNLSSLDISLVNDMGKMFKDCSSLRFLYFSKIKNSKLVNIEEMFSGCKSLVSIDLNNLDISLITSMKKSFYECSSLISLDLSSFNTSSVINMHQTFDGCTSLKILNLSNFDTNSVDNMIEMFNNCKSLISLDISNFKMKNSLFMDNMFNGDSNLVFVNIYNLTCDKKIFKNLFNQLKKIKACCINEKSEIFNISNNLILENHICMTIDCSGDLQIIQKKLLENENCFKDCFFSENKYKYKDVCYKNCPNGTISSSINEYICEEEIGEENEYIYEYNYFLAPPSEKNRNCSINIFLNQECENKSKNIFQIISQIINDIKIGLMNPLLINITNKKGNDLIIKYMNCIFQITSSFNQKNKKYDNISSIDLGENENILKESYNINKNETLLIFKIDYFLQGLLIPIITYEIFDPITKKQLSFDNINNTKIKYNIPISINEEKIFMHNPYSDYYNDICFNYKEKSGNDITLYDRKNEYNNNNMSLCERNCNFNGYDEITKKVLCICDDKNKSPLNLKDIINTDELLNKFINFKSISNIEIIKCFKTLFSKEGILFNIGSYILLSIILIYIVSFFFFIIMGFKNLLKKINNIIDSKKKIEQESMKNSSLPLKNRENKIIKENNLIDSTKKEYITKIKHKKNKYLNYFYFNYADIEINTLSYKEALDNDKRTFLQYYISILKRKHLLIFAFYPNNDYNSMIIKICLFFFSFALFLTINTLFFNDSTMHKLYENKGIFNFIYFIPQILYSNLICSLINIIIRFLSLSENNILKLKKEKNIIECERMIPKLLRILYTKFIFFYIISFSLLFIFWYYISSFCAVYKNTKINLIKESLISFGLYLIYPFILCLIPALIRIILIKKPETFLKCLYKFSKIIS